MMEFGFHEKNNFGIFYVQFSSVTTIPNLIFSSEHFREKFHRFFDFVNLKSLADFYLKCLEGIRKWNSPRNPLSVENENPEKINLAVTTTLSSTDSIFRMKTAFDSIFGTDELSTFINIIKIKAQVLTLIFCWVFSSPLTPRETAKSVRLKLL